MRLSLKSEPTIRREFLRGNWPQEVADTVRKLLTASYAGVPGKTTWMSRPFKRHC